MTVCPHCGTTNLPQAAACSSCGKALATAGPPPVNSAKTVLGLGGLTGTVATTGADRPISSTTSYGVAPAVQSPDGARPNDPTPDRSGAGPARAQTILGVAPSLAAPPAATPPEPNAPDAKPPQTKTILGIALPMPTPEQETARLEPKQARPRPVQAQTLLGIALPTPPDTETPAAAPETTRGGWTVKAGGTLLMSAEPVRARLGTGPAGTLRFEPVTDSQAPAAVPSGAPSAEPGLPVEKKTLLGVARPGIAPTNPHEPKPRPEPPQQQAHRFSQPGPVPLDSEDQAWPQESSPVNRPARALWIVIGLACGLVAVGAAALWWVYRDSGPIRAQAALDATGKDVLNLLCEECVDGTTVRLNEHSTAFTGQHATLPLSKPLALGNNTLEVELSPPNSAARDRVSLRVPVLYRVRGDLSALQQEPPKLAVAIEALRGTQVVVDGHPVSLAANGTARYEVDASKDLTGPNARLARLQRTLEYSLTPPDSDPQSGQVALQVGITPLLVLAPGSSIVTEAADFMLAGQTEAGATLSVGGRAIAVDPTGRFTQLMNVSAVGETTILVRATAPERAPRIVPVRVRRVASLKAEAQRLKLQSTSTYNALSPSTTAGVRPNVLVSGVVLESRPQDHTTVLLLDVPSGCAQRPCLARVVHGSKLEVRRDERVTVAGYVSKTVDGPRAGTKIPELHADFVVSEDR